MRHVVLTCRNHPYKRWWIESAAWSDREMRNAAYLHYARTNVEEECACPASDLERAPEDRVRFPAEMHYDKQITIP